MTDTQPSQQGRLQGHFSSLPAFFVFSSLRQRNYRLFWSGQLISSIGTWMQSIGQYWLVLSLTKDPWYLGLLGALQALPILLFSLFGGVLADHWPKHKFLLVLQIVALLQAFLFWFLLVAGLIQLWHLYLLVFVLGVTNSMSRPVRRAFVIEMVGGDDLPNALALNASTANFARIIGPGLGGIILAAGGLSFLFLLNALSFLPIVAGLLLLKKDELFLQMGPERKKSNLHNLWQSLYEGMNYIFSTPALLNPIVIVGLVLLFGSNFGVVLPFFATDVFHEGATGFGFFSAATGIGSLLAALWVAWRNKRPTIRQLLVGMLLFVFLEIGFACSPVYLLSLVLIMGVGFTETFFAELAMILLQAFTPQSLHGRVISVQLLFFDGSLPLGYLLIGWLSSVYGPVAALVIGALLCLLVIVPGWLWSGSAEEHLLERARYEEEEGQS